jgi:hypothetical protein
MGFSYFDIDIFSLGVVLPKRHKASFEKRRKERERQERKLLKEERRAQRRAAREKAATNPGEDPDIAGIVPGPQPSPWEDHAMPSEE